MDLRILTSPTILKPDVNLYANSVTAGTITAVNTFNVADLEVKGDLLVDGSFSSSSINVGNVLLSSGTQAVVLPVGTGGGTPSFNTVLDKLIFSGLVGANTAASTVDGATWLQLTTPFANPSIQYSPSLNIYTGIDNSGTDVYLSPTAVDLSWVAQAPSGTAFATSYLEWVPFFGRFYANSADLARRIISSTDGSVWATQVSARDSLSIAFSPLLSRLVAVGSVGPQYTDDGKTWFPSASTVSMSHVCWSPFWKCYVATPRGAPLDKIYKSVDGINWTNTVGFPGYTDDLRTIVWSEEMMVFVAAGDVDAQFISQDGLLWRQSQLVPAGDKYGNTYISKWGMYAASGIGGFVRESAKLFV